MLTGWPEHLTMGKVAGTPRGKVSGRAAAPEAGREELLSPRSLSHESRLCGCASQGCDRAGDARGSGVLCVAQSELWCVYTVVLVQVMIFQLMVKLCSVADSIVLLSSICQSTFLSFLT